MRWYFISLVVSVWCKLNQGANSSTRYKRLPQTNDYPYGPPQSQRAYVCVLTGTCLSNLNNTYTIDPRADFDEDFCPIGQEPCFGQQSPPRCGVRYIASLNNTDGPSSFGAHPWMAYIINQTGFTGSGALIDQHHVLTAAHKVYLNINSPSSLRLYMGVWDPINMAGSQNFTVRRILIHPNFDPENLKNDIAILRLATPAVLGLQINVGTACLTNPKFSFVGRTCVVSGWGQSSFGAFDAPRQVQYQVSVPIVDFVTCRTSMSQPHILGAAADRFLDSAGELCAGGRAQVDACTQDGGSPLMCQSESSGRFFVAGLVIWGKRCGEPGVFGVYVNVPYYVSWIKQNIIFLDQDSQ